MRRLTAALLSLALIFTTTACTHTELLDTNSENTESNCSDFTTERNDGGVNEESKNEALSKQKIYSSVSSFMSNIPYDPEIYSTYNFTDENTIFFFQFYIFGNQRRLFYLLKSSNGGQTWYPQNVQSFPYMYWREHIICAKMLDESVVLISGRLFATDDNFSERTYITKNGGIDWTPIVLPSTPPYLNDEATLISNYLDGEAYDLTQENGVYYLHVRVSDLENYHYLRYCSTDLENWTYVGNENNI